MDKKFLSSFKKYSKRLKRSGRFYVEETPRELTYEQDESLRKKLGLSDFLDITKSSLLFLIPSAIFAWLTFYLAKEPAVTSNNPDFIKYIVPIGLIVTTFYTIVFVPMLIIRETRRKKMFCSACGSALRSFSDSHATWYVCDHCQRLTGVANLDLGGPP